MTASTAPTRRGWFSRWFDALGNRALGTDPEAFEPQAVERAMGRLDWVFRSWFPVRWQGFEHVPAGPLLVVANHSGGTTIPDTWGLVHGWYRQFGVARPLHPLAHEMVFTLRAVAEPFARGGVLRADKEVALRTLTELGRDVLVMPGGDVETWRPYRDRYRLRWGKRRGYARLALEAGVPILPIACAGAHETLRVLSDGRWLGRALGIYKLARSEVFPIHLSLPWGLGVGPLPHIPLPTRLRFRIGRPVLPPAEGLAEEDRVARLDRAVRARMQTLLDELAAQ